MSRRPAVEGLEQRQVLSTGASPVFTALTTNRYWIDYAPSYDSASSPYEANPTDARIKSDLQTLYGEGWRGLVTYTIAGSYANIPKIAKGIGFDYVIAGIYDPKSSTELAAASSPDVLNNTDAYVVGNEGIQDGRYTFSELASAIAQVQGSTNKPVTTSEPGGQYYTGSTYSTQLLSTGDWLFPNIDYFLWNNQPSTPDAMWNNVSFFYDFAVRNNKTQGPVVAKEVFFPTDGGAGASESLQVDWYRKASTSLVNGSPFYFVWGEAFDQPWKNPGNGFDTYEPHMGLHRINKPDGTRDPKPIIQQLQPFYAGRYGSIPTTTSVKASARSSLQGKVQLAAAVRSNKLGLPAQGFVRFFSGDQFLGQAHVVDGVARLRATLPQGTTSLTAVFSGKRRHLRSLTTVSFASPS